MPFVLHRQLPLALMCSWRGRTMQLRAMGKQLKKYFAIGLQPKGIKYNSLLGTVFLVQSFGSWSGLCVDVTHCKRTEREKLLLLLWWCTVPNRTIKILLQSFNIVTREGWCKETDRGGNEQRVRESKHYNKHSINIKSHMRQIEEKKPVAKEKKRGVEVRAESFSRTEQLCCKSFSLCTTTPEASFWSPWSPQTLRKRQPGPFYCPGSLVRCVTFFSFFFPWCYDNNQNNRHCCWGWNQLENAVPDFQRKMPNTCWKGVKVFGHNLQSQHQWLSLGATNQSWKP